MLTRSSAPVPIQICHLPIGVPGIKASVTWNYLIQKYWNSRIQTHVDKYSTYIAIIWNENKNPRSSLSPVHKDIHAPPPPPTPHHRHHHHGHQGLTCTQGHPCSSVHHDLANASTSQRAGCNLGTWKVKMVKMFRIVKIILGYCCSFIDWVSTIQPAI